MIISRYHAGLRKRDIQDQAVPVLDRHFVPNIIVPMEHFG